MGDQESSRGLHLRGVHEHLDTDAVAALLVDHSEGVRAVREAHRALAAAQHPHIKTHRSLYAEQGCWPTWNKSMFSTDASFIN